MYWDFAGHDADRESAADHFAVGGDVGLDAVEPLRAMRAVAEAADHFVEDEKGIVLVGEGAELLHEFLGLEFRAAALHGLNHDGREFVGMLFKNLHRLLGAVIEHEHVRDGGLGHAGGAGEGAGLALGLGTAQEDFVKVTVVVFGENGDLVTTGGGARKAHGRLHGFGASADKGATLVAGHLAEHLRGLADEGRLWTHFEAGAHLLLHCFQNKVRGVAEEAGAESVEDVDVFVAIDIEKAGAFRFLDHELIDHLLPVAIEPRDSARISVEAAILGGPLFGRFGARDVAADELVDMRALLVGQAFIGVTADSRGGAGGAAGWGFLLFRFGRLFRRSRRGDGGDRWDLWRCGLRERDGTCWSCRDASEHLHLGLHELHLLHLHVHHLRHHGPLLVSGSDRGGGERLRESWLLGC